MTQSGKSKVVVSLPSLVQARWWSHPVWYKQGGGFMSELPSLIQARWWSHERTTQSGTSKVVVS
ncbi:hypothetical protein DPMN_025088 [Dreissena polymorpha]|uniref:Uncharacterized protein n=1 Tax=Dreissena polymorpha TaxID=45954 RepID=A0A9D4RDA2_DREPO|nr:hypothetical protein DPMN_025088 [Dreissena polymorpha]